MAAKVVFAVVIGALLFAGISILRGGVPRTVEIQRKVDPAPTAEEEILQAFFSQDLAQKLVTWNCTRCQVRDGVFQMSGMIQKGDLHEPFEIFVIDLPTHLKGSSHS